MRERGGGLRFALEAHHPVRVARKLLGQDLERDLALELAVAGAVDLAHPARAERGDDLVTSELLALERAWLAW